MLSSPKLGVKFIRNQEAMSKMLSCSLLWKELLDSRATGHTPLGHVIRTALIFPVKQDRGARRQGKSRYHPSFLYTHRGTPFTHQVVINCSHWAVNKKW